MQTESRHTVRDLVEGSASTFEAIWNEAGIPAVREVGDTEITPVYNRGAFAERLRANRSELDDRAAELEEAGMESRATALREAKVYRGMGKLALMRAASADDSEKIDKAVLEEMEARNVIDRTVAEESTPLAFDPDILESLKGDSPLIMGRTRRRGQQGYTAVYNRVDSRESPIGRVPESVVRRLQDYARDFGFNRQDVDMKIYADTAEISDFSATASADYMDLEEIGVGARMSEFALFIEQEGLYGRYNLDSLSSNSDGTFEYAEGGGTNSALEGGSPLGGYAARGLAEWYRLAQAALDDGDAAVSAPYDIVTDKSGTTSDFATDLKAEVAAMLQGPFATRPQDLEIWCSETFKDTVENDFVGRARHDTNQNVIQFGGEEISIKQDIGLHTSPQIDQHTFVAQDEDGDIQDAWDEYESGDADYEDRNVGDEGDVFIVNTAAWEARELSPLASFPLAIRGASNEVAMVQYGANVELSGGLFGRYLQAYGI